MKIRVGDKRLFFDVAGAGRSDDPPDDIFSLERRADDIAERLMRSLIMMILAAAVHEEFWRDNRAPRVPTPEQETGISIDPLYRRP